jgi:hypothetical protein
MRLVWRSEIDADCVARRVKARGIISSPEEADRDRDADAGRIVTMPGSHAYVIVLSPLASCLATIQLHLSQRGTRPESTGDTGDR